LPSKRKNYYYSLSQTPCSKRRITKNKYEEKRKEYRTKQKEITKKISKLNYADEEYYLTSEYLLKLASNASKLFESSEVHEKRLLLKMTLQNLELKGKKVRFDWIKPFNKIANLASRQAWLLGEDSNLRPAAYTNPFVSKWRGLSHPLLF